MTNRAVNPQREKIALFVAGDKNIFFPALVCLTSIRAHNGDVFDYFMCFDGDEITEEQKELLAKASISFVDARLLREYYDISSLRSWNAGRWPIAIFNNWLLPLYFNDNGYEWSIKVDYDLLCVGRYELSEILPGGSVVSGLVFDVKLGRRVSPEVIRALCETYDIDLGKKCYLNAGFVAFNNGRYVREGVSRRFLDIYAAILKYQSDVAALEQVALAFALSTLAEPIRMLDKKYNLLVSFLPDLDEQKVPLVANIHYFTGNKPWRPLPQEFDKKFEVNKRRLLIFYRNLWLRYAETLPGFLQYCQESEIDPLRMVGYLARLVKSLEAKE